MDYFVRQGSDAEGLSAELDTPERRRAYVGAMYADRGWAAKGSFTHEDVAYHSEPFASAAALRAAIAVYEVGFGKRAISEPPVLAQSNPVPTLILYGPRIASSRATFRRAWRSRFRITRARSRSPDRVTSSRGSSPSRCTTICAHSFRR
jgi:hypothetical protein